MNILTLIGLLVILTALLFVALLVVRRSPVLTMRCYATMCSVLGVALLFHVRLRRQGYKRTEFRGTTIIQTPDLGLAIESYNNAIEGKVNEKGYCYIGSEVLHAGADVEPQGQRQSSTVLPGLPAAAAGGPSDQDQVEGEHHPEQVSGQGSEPGAGSGQAARPAMTSLFEPQ